LSPKSIALHSLRLGQSLAGHLPSVGRFRPVKGTFSAYERLLRGELEGTVLAERQEVGVCPPGSMTELAKFRQHDHQPWPVFWTRADDATLVGKLHLWRDPGDMLCAEAVYNHPAVLRLGEDRWNAQFFLSKPEQLEGAWTSLSSKWNDGGNYFHWLLDGLTRLQLRETLPEDTRILIPARAPRFVNETLDLLGLGGQTHRTEHPSLRPDRYYFCAPTAMTGVLNPQGFDWLREKFSPYYGQCESGAPVFLTRRGAARVPANIGEIEARFEGKGFEIVDCGAITVAEQIRKLSAAPAIAGLHGAAMTNLLWANPRTPVLELFQPGYRNACYEQIAFQGQLDYTHHVLEGENPLRTIEEWLDRQR
jgi:hypothetical protein